MSRKKLIRLITFLAGIYFFLEFVLPEEVFGVKFSSWHEQITFAFQVVGSSAFALGLISIVRQHGTEILLLRKKWFYSLALITGLFAMLAVTALDWYAAEQINTKVKKIMLVAEFATKINQDNQNNQQVENSWVKRKTTFVNYANAQLEYLNTTIVNNPDLVFNINQTKIYINNFSNSNLTQIPDSLVTSFKQLANDYNKILLLAFDQSKTKFAYRILFEGFFISLGAAMFSLLGFYIASAAYRAFRIQSLEASLMMLAALCVMLGQISFGPMIWEELPTIRHWLLTVPNTAAFRAIEIGTAIAAIVISFRMWLSIESDSFISKK